MVDSVQIDSGPSRPDVEARIAHALRRYTAEHCLRSVAGGPIAAVVVSWMLHSTPFRSIEVAWTIVAAATAPMTAWWCWKQRRADTVRALPLRLIVGGHTAIVVSMPLFFDTAGDLRDATLEAAIVAAITITFFGHVGG
jgi:hypothetical protein